MSSEVRKQLLEDIERSAATAEDVAAVLAELQEKQKKFGGRTYSRNTPDCPNFLEWGKLPGREVFCVETVGSGPVFLDHMCVRRVGEAFLRWANAWDTQEVATEAEKVPASADMEVVYRCSTFPQDFLKVCKSVGGKVSVLGVELLEDDVDDDSDTKSTCINLKPDDALIVADRIRRIALELKKK